VAVTTALATGSSTLTLGDHRHSARGL